MSHRSSARSGHGPFHSIVRRSDLAADRITRLDGIPISILVMVGAAVRTLHLHESLWIDELHTSWVVMGDWSSLIHRSTIGNQSPLYFAIVKTICSVCGPSEGALRSLSLVLSVLLIPISVAMVWRWTSSRAAAYLAGALISLDPDFAYFGAEARPYALVQFVGFIQLFLFVELCRVRISGTDETSDSDTPRARIRERRLHGAWLICSILLFYVHYTAVLVVGTQIALSLVFGRHGVALQRMRRAAFDIVWLMLLSLPVAGHLFAISQRRENWEAFVYAWPVVDALNAMGLARIVDKYLLVPSSLACLSIGLVWIVANQFLPTRSWTRLLLLISSSFVLPVVIAWCLTASGVYAVFHLRYLLLPAVTGAIFAALCASATQLKTLGYIVAIVIFAFCCWDGAYWRLATDQRALTYPARGEDWRDAIHWVNTGLSAEQNELVVVYPDLIEDRLLASDSTSDRWIEYCAYPVSGLYRIDRFRADISAGPTRTRSGTRSQHVERIRQDNSLSRIWLMIRGDSDLIAEIEREWTANCKSLGISCESQRHRFGRVGVVRLDLH